MPRPRGAAERRVEAEIQSERLDDAGRPERRTSTTSAGFSLCPATFVDLSPEQERRAVEALAELLVPWLGVAPGSPSGPIPVHLVPAGALTNGQRRPAARNDIVG